MAIISPKRRELTLLEYKSITSSEVKAGSIMANLKPFMSQVCVILVVIGSINSNLQMTEASKSDNHKIIMPTVVTVEDKLPLMELKSPHLDSSIHEAKIEPIFEVVALSGKAGAGKELLEARMDDGEDDLSTLAGHKKYVLVKKKPKHKKIKMEVYKPKMKYKKIKIKVPVKKMKKKKVKGYMIKKEHDHYA